jgi:hypothetical protein
MSSKIKIHAAVAPAEKQHPRGAAVSGTLYLQIGDAYFPTEGWVDLVVPTLGWWMDNALRLSSPDAGVVNRFMDGAYQIRIARPADSMQLLLELTDGKRAVHEPLTVDFARYLAALRGAAKSVLREVRMMGLPLSPDISSMETGLEHLQRLEEQIRIHGVK